MSSPSRQQGTNASEVPFLLRITLWELLDVAENAEFRAMLLRPDAPESSKGGAEEAGTRAVRLIALANELRRCAGRLIAPETPGEPGPGPIERPADGGSLDDGGLASWDRRAARRRQGQKRRIH